MAQKLPVNREVHEGDHVTGQELLLCHFLKETDKCTRT